MDENEAPAMTEASGSTHHEAGRESASRETHASQFEAQLRSSVVRVSEQLRQGTLQAPLRVQEAHAA
jgi:hypothetical protein